MPYRHGRPWCENLTLYTEITANMCGIVLLSRNLHSSMKSRFVFILALILSCLAARADLTRTDWMPIYKGVDRAVGTNFPSTLVTNNGVVFTDSTLQVANCVR